MPVDFESYHLNDLPDEGTNGRRILEHLAQHSELGFTPSELADELDIPRGSVGTTLSRLDERGLVRHKGEYWAINIEAYDAQTASEIGLRAVADRFEGDHDRTGPTLATWSTVRPVVGDRSSHNAVMRTDDRAVLPSASLHLGGPKHPHLVRRWSNRIRPANSPRTRPVI